MDSRWGWLLIFVAVLLGCTAARESPPTSATPIFRYVALNRDTLWLDRPLGSFARFAKDPTDTIVTVPLGEYGGADAIQVHRTGEDTVTSFTFLYGPRLSMDTLRAEYAASLGVPVEQGLDSVAGVARRYWLWRDTETDFTLAVFSMPIDGAIGAARLASRRRRAP